MQGKGRKRSPGHPPDDSATDTDSDGERIRSRRSERTSRSQTQRVEAAQKSTQGNAAQPLKRKAHSGKARSTGISLQYLVQENLLQPGKGVLTIEYKSQIIKGDLREDGVIVYEYNGLEHTYESPSAFSIAVKRQINPSRKADDGWKTVKFQGKFLEFYKKKVQGEGPGKPDKPVPAAKRARVNGNATAELASKPNATLKPVEAPAQPILRIQNVGRNLEEEASMMPCRRFRADAESSTQARQPFPVQLSSSAAIFMDFHAHLSENEVIGVLTGQWDTQTQAMRIERAYPVKEQSSEEDTSMVAMSPSAKLSTLESLQERNLRCVGWYHSHPHALPNPSSADIAYQIQQQESEGSREGALPQFAVIVSPYKGAQDNGQAGMTTFQARSGPDLPQADDRDPSSSEAIEFEVTKAASKVDDPYIKELQTALIKQAVQQCSATNSCADLSKPWHEGQSRRQKIMQSLTSQLPSGWADGPWKEFVQNVEKQLLELRTLEPQVKKEEEPEISQSTASVSSREHKTGPVKKESTADGPAAADTKGPLPSAEDKAALATEATQIEKVSTEPTKAAVISVRDLPVRRRQNGKEIKDGASTETSTEAPQDFSGLEGKNFFDSDHNLEGLESLNEVDSLSRLEDMSHW